MMRDHEDHHDHDVNAKGNGGDKSARDGREKGKK
jgi:hypothetical protein